MIDREPNTLVRDALVGEKWVAADTLANVQEIFGSTAHNQAHPFEGIVLEQNYARELIGRLDGQEQDILGLITLGLTNREIGESISRAEIRVKVDLLPEIYRKLGIAEQKNILKRRLARYIACSANLLRQAWEAEFNGGYELLQTGKVITDNYLGINDVTAMEKYGITPYQLYVSKLLAVGMSRHKVGAMMTRPDRATTTIYRHTMHIKNWMSSDEVRDNIGAILASEKASEPLANLNSRQKDMLGLVTLGLSCKEIARKFELKEGTVNGYLPKVYKAIEAPKEKGITRQVNARKIAWAGGLLIEALVSLESALLEETRKEIINNNLDRNDVDIMSKYGLTIVHMRLLSYEAQGLTSMQMGALEFFREDGGISHHFREIRKSLKSKETERELVEKLAARIGRRALRAEAALDEAA